mgnify:CR=1 FL=1
MMSKKKLKLKKFYFHPITTFIILTIVTVILSGILSNLGMYATYSKLNMSTGKLESTIVTIENLCNYDGIKYIISNAVKNFMSFTTLSTLLISLIGLSVAKSTGFLDTFIKRKLVKIDNKKITFILILLATISSLINEIGYVILIPLAAIIYMANNRNPLAGITAAFTGVAFGYGATIFVGSMEVNLNSITQLSARLIDTGFHVSLTSNLFIIIISTIILSIVGTIIIEKMILPKLGRYKSLNDINKTLELDVIDDDLEEQVRLEKEINEKKGLKYAFIATIVMLIVLVYSLIPNLPFSGILLDMNERTYLGQLFGENAYFQDGFNYLVSLYFIITGICYGIGSKSIKNDKDIIYGANEYLKESVNLIGLLFFASQFIAVFKKTNIGTILTAWGAELINNVEFTGLPLILIIILVIALSNIFITTPLAKWTILAPVVVPKLMQSNIAPQFAQFILRAGDSMTKGITPVLAYFVIFVGYLNIYNADKKRPITIGNSLKLIMPYCLFISITWILIIILWYIIGLPLGPNVFPTL